MQRGRPPSRGAVPQQEDDAVSVAAAKAAAPGSDGLIVDNIGKSFRGRAVVKGVSLRLRRG